jgi:hypothetical protein
MKLYHLLENAWNWRSSLLGEKSRYYKNKYHISSHLQLGGGDKAIKIKAGLLGRWKGKGKEGGYERAIEG